MPTELLRVDANRPEPDAIARAAEVIRSGGLVAFPTETVYGLGANALDAAAVARIFEAKGRPANNPLIVHVAGAEETRRLAAEWPEEAELLAARFWPGPLTLVLPKRDVVPDIVTAGGPTVAVRAPAHPVARALIAAAGAPIAAPSANRSTQVSPTTAAHVLRGLEGRIDLVLDGGSTPGGIESTVLALTGGTPRLLRPGLVTASEIESVVGPVRRPMGAQDEGAVALPSPGMMRRHYAPHAPLELAAGDARERIEALAGQGVRVGALVFAPLDAPGVAVLVMPADPRAYAARLYAALHQLDDMRVGRIVAEAPPDTEEWAAVRDRLRRASVR